MEIIFISDKRDFKTKAINYLMMERSIQEEAYTHPL